MGGHSKVVDTTPKQTQQTRSGVIDYLNKGPGYSQMNAAPVPGVQTAGPVSTMFNSGSDVNRGMIGNVSSAPTQSVDQLGGANSAFFKNMMSQLQPSFDQSRSEGLAAAREGAGSLTGSGFANALGSSINRSLGNQQATLANYASQGVQAEMGRQQADAARQLSANQGNQGADTSFMNALLSRNQQGLQAQQLGLQAQTQNQNTQQGANNLQFQGNSDTANQNAQRFMQMLMGQSTAGIAPGTIQTSGGIGSILSPIAGIAGQAAGAGARFGF